MTSTEKSITLNAICYEKLSFAIFSKASESEEALDNIEGLAKRKSTSK